jgi:hypothetical protein
MRTEPLSSFEHVEEPRGRSYSREEIDGCSDLETLSEWFLASDQRELHIRSFLEAMRTAEIDDETWFRRTGGALAYCVIGKRWIERRILILGGEPPYAPTDPRARALRVLNEKVAKLERRVAELGGGTRE